MTVQDLLYILQDAPKEYEVLMYDLDTFLYSMSTTYTLDTHLKRICLEASHAE